MEPIIESPAPGHSESPGADTGQVTTDDTVVRQLKAFFSVFRSGSTHHQLAPSILAIFAVICATVAGQLRLNAWYKDFYNAIERRNLHEFMFELLVFGLIVGALLILNVAQTWLNQMIKLKTRERLTRDLVGEWLTPKRDFLLSGAGPIGLNPDQRIHEDAHHLSELTADLGIGLVQAFLLLVSFIGVLWALSSGVLFELSGKTFSIPGYMVWCALLYAIIGSFLSWRVGRPLVALNVERYQREADLRFELVRTNENIDAIALYKGESHESARLNREIDRLLKIIRRIVGAITRLTWVTAGYGWIAIVIPILAAAPGYFEGHLSFGDLMMVAGAFNQVQQSLRWFVDNFGSIADWRATLRRVIGFRQALLKLSQPTIGASRIVLVENDTTTLVLDNPVVSLVDGTATLEPGHVEIGLGEHVLILGKAGAGKSYLFRAIAGLWPWGSGTIHIPHGAKLSFLPQRPYVPPGTLRSSLCYPITGQCPDDAALAAALKRVGLDKLIDWLDKDARWDKDLTHEHQQRVAFARLLLAKPDFIFLDEAFEMLEEDYRQTIASIFDKELEHAAVISFARHAAPNEGFRRVVHLIHEPPGDESIEDALEPNTEGARPADPALNIQAR